MSAIESDTRATVLHELRDRERFVLLTHENPDGDALGSLLGMYGVLQALGKDVQMFMAPSELPLPDEYGFMDFAQLRTDAPADLADRTVVFLDCGNIDRNPAEAFKADDARILNLDHHHDNTCFGAVNHVVVEASCTAEIVWDLARALGVTPTPQVAEALYVGLITDTGRFMYENTTARAHVMAAELLDAGVDVHRVYRELYEDLPYAKLDLLGRALGKLERHDDGRLTLARLTRADFAAADADDSASEGIVDHLRAVAGTLVAGLARELPDGRKKVSLRATDGSVDVSVIARAAGGGGHRQAAGFSTSLGDAELVTFLREQITAQRQRH